MEDLIIPAGAIVATVGLILLLRYDWGRLVIGSAGAAVFLVFGTEALTTGRHPISWIICFTLFTGFMILFLSSHLKE